MEREFGYIRHVNYHTSLSAASSCQPLELRVAGGWPLVAGRRKRLRLRLKLRRGQLGGAANRRRLAERSISQ